MRLSTFILENLEAILQAWEDFARSVETPLDPLSNKGLRNHAEQILTTAALDMRAPQSSQEQFDKSQGQGPVSETETAAQAHGVLRLMDGFTLDQMVSEFRAIRASVLRLWLAREFEGRDYQVDDMIRFNEAMDQALSESIASYGKAVESTRKTVLAVLGHDLRSPLGAALMGADLLRKSRRLEDKEKTIASQVAISVQRANQMVTDLLDLARVNLGTGIPVHCAETELREVCRGIVAEVSLAHPHVNIASNAPTSVRGQFDPARIAQVFANLINNAVRHGDAERPININLTSEDGTASFSVQNYGAPISPEALPFLFSPEGRYSRYSNDSTGAAAGLGLGLFIASEIVRSHGGTIAVKSTLEQGTTFSVVMPLGIDTAAS